MSEYESDGEEPHRTYLVKTESTVAWALPVSATALGASLHAYVDLLPTLNAFRLCHRYGRGPDVAITRLPVEVIAQIETHLFRDRRSHHRIEWEKDANCFHLACQMESHFTEEELDGIHSLFSATADSSEEDLARSQRKKDIERLITKDSRGKYIVWAERCEGRRDTWNSRFASEGFFATSQEMIRRHFGVEVWFTRALPAPTARSERLHRVIAYLTLADGGTRSTPWEHWPYRPSMGNTTIDHDFGFPIKILKTPRSAELQKFKRMLNVMFLGPLDNGLNEGDQLNFGGPLNFSLRAMMLSRCATQIDE